MIKLFNPIKKDTNIKGYWLFKGKLYKDNIQILKFNSVKEFNKVKLELFNKELSIFYIIGKQAFIEDRQRKVKVLKNCRNYKKDNLTSELIIELCKQYGGLTIYNNKRGLTVEIWTP